MVNDEPLLPLRSSELAIFIDGLNPEVASQYGTVVTDPDDADVIILNIGPPHDPGYGTLVGIELFREGRLYYTTEELDPILELMDRKPTVITT